MKLKEKKDSFVVRIFNLKLIFLAFKNLINQVLLPLLSSPYKNQFEFYTSDPSWDESNEDAFTMLHIVLRSEIKYIYR